MTSKRTYKDAFSVQESNRIIKEGRGKHFDPNVVDAFFTVQDEILHIKGLFTDQRHDPIDLSDQSFFDGTINSIFETRAATG